MRNASFKINGIFTNVHCHVSVEEGPPTPLGIKSSPYSFV